MKPGDLVTIVRASIGVSAGTIGFVLREYKGTTNCGSVIYEVDIIGKDRRAPIWARRYLARDLEVIK